MTDDPIRWFDGSDAEMLDAILNAQNSFPEFIGALELDTHRIIPAIETAIVKAFFSSPNSGGEHMFVDSITVDDGIVTGVLASEPQYVTELSEGDEVTFPVSRVSDWFLVIDGKATGGFSLPLISARMTPDQRQEVMKYPPFSWYR